MFWGLKPEAFKHNIDRIYYLKIDYTRVSYVRSKNYMINLRKTEVLPSASCRVNYDGTI